MLLLYMYVLHFYGLSFVVGLPLLLLAAIVKACKIMFGPVVSAIETPDIDKFFSHLRYNKGRGPLLGASHPRRATPCSPFPVMPNGVLASCLDSSSNVTLFANFMWRGVVRIKTKDVLPAVIVLQQ